MVVFVVKRYAVREAKKWRYAVRNTKIRRYAVRKGGGGVTLNVLNLLSRLSNMPVFVVVEFTMLSKHTIHNSTLVSEFPEFGSILYYS